MKVLITNSHPDRSETHLYKELHSAGVDIEVITAPSAIRYSELAEAGVPITKLPFRFRIDFSAIRNIRNKLKTEKCDIIHTFNKRSLSNIMIASVGLPARIITYRGIIGNLSRWNPETRLTFMNKRVRRIICVCEAVRKYLLSLGIPSSRLITIHKGHDLSWYQNAPRADLTQFGIPAGASVVGCAAMMRPRKGIGILLESTRNLPSNFVHLLLVGKISDRKIKPLIAKMELERIVHLTGFRNDAAALMGACDIFVMPSLRREGLPRAVIEAMAQGVPAIVTNVGGMPEIVDNHINGLIVPPNDPRALAKAIQYLIDNPSQRRLMGEQARKKIQTCFNIQTTIRQTMELYKQVLAEP